MVKNENYKVAKRLRKEDPTTPDYFHIFYIQDIWYVCKHNKDIKRYLPLIFAI